jgi:hypothetical protein
MSDSTVLARIEETLCRVAATQDALCKEVGALRQRVDSLAAKGGMAASREETIRFLDRFRAGEAFGEISTGVWIDASDVDCVRGGLRVVQQREGMHARLLAERIKQLGGACTREIPQETQEKVLRSLGDKQKGDAAKVLDFVKANGDAERALAPIYEIASRLDHDPETQSLLRTIAQDERSTIEFMNEACKLLNA